MESSARSLSKLVAPGLGLEAAASFCLPLSDALGGARVESAAGALAEADASVAALDSQVVASTPVAVAVAGASAAEYPALLLPDL